jgi:hypothetical protein
MDVFSPRQSAFRGYVQCFTYSPRVIQYKDLENFFEIHQPHLYSILREAIEYFKHVRFFISVKVKLYKLGEEDLREVHFTSKCERVWANGMLEFALESAISKITGALEIYNNMGSGLLFGSVMEATLHIGKFKPYRGGLGGILPEKIKKKRAILNVKSPKNHCFTFAILAGLFPKPQNAERYTSYIKHLKTLVDIPSYPVKLEDIPKFEKANSITINVFGYEREEVFPLKISQENYPREVNLFLHQNHYYLIKDFNRLASKFKNQNVCLNCMYGFKTRDLLEGHRAQCKTHGFQKVSYPEPDDAFITFNKFSSRFKQNFVFYCDFESILEPINHSRHYSEHIPCSYSYVIVDSESNVIFRDGPYVGRDCVEKFLASVWDKVKELKQILNTCAPMELTPEQEQSFQDATHCHICHQIIEGTKVRDHSHYNPRNLNGTFCVDKLLPGEYRGAAHVSCNFKFHNNSKFRVFFHNLKNYDLHHIIKSPFLKGKKIDVIPLSIEKYLSLFCEDVIFLDSYQFLSASLETLAATLPTSELKVLTACLPKHVELFSKKGYFPYEWLDNFTKFNETKLPPIEAFTSSLTNTTLTQEQYAFAQHVWEATECKTMKDFHNFYLLSDVLLLTDIFQYFRNLCMNFYEIDPVLSFSLPGVTWDAALKKTKVTLQLFSEPAMHLMVESGIRGGVAMIGKRSAKANHSQLSTFNPELPQSHLLYLDAGK